MATIDMFLFVLFAIAIAAPTVAWIFLIVTERASTCSPMQVAVTFTPPLPRYNEVDYEVVDVSPMPTTYSSILFVRTHVLDLRPDGDVVLDGEWSMVKAEDKQSYTMRAHGSVVRYRYHHNTNYSRAVNTRSTLSTTITVHEERVKVPVPTLTPEPTYHYILVGSTASEQDMVDYVSAFDLVLYQVYPGYIGNTTVWDFTSKDDPYTIHSWVFLDNPELVMETEEEMWERKASRVRPSAALGVRGSHTKGWKHDRVARQRCVYKHSMVMDKQWGHTTYMPTDEDVRAWQADEDVHVSTRTVQSNKPSPRKPRQKYKGKVVQADILNADYLTDAVWEAREVSNDQWKAGWCKWDEIDIDLEWVDMSNAIDAEELLHQGEWPFEFLCDICGSNACSCEEDDDGEHCCGYGECDCDFGDERCSRCRQWYATCSCGGSLVSETWAEYAKREAYLDTVVEGKTNREWEDIHSSLKETDEGPGQQADEDFKPDMDVLWANVVKSFELLGQWPFEFRCDTCGSNACSCEEDKAINDQEEYDKANNLCLNCHQNPCCFDCVYDDDPQQEEDDFGAEAEVAKRKEAKTDWSKVTMEDPFSITDF